MEGELYKKIREKLRPDESIHIPDINSAWANKVCELILNKAKQSFPYKKSAFESGDAEEYFEDVIDWFLLQFGDHQ